MELPKLAVKAREDEDYSHCFGCGKANPIGLKLKFKWDGKEGRAEFTPGENHQGWPGYVHGGVLLCMLDEACGYGAMYAGANAVTARMDTRLKRMAVIGEPLVITCSIVKSSKRLVEVEAKIITGDGKEVAEGFATQYVFSQREEKPQSNA